MREELSRRDLFEFACYTYDKIEQDSNWFHETYYGLLQLFFEGKLPRLIVSCPPQHGKSEGSSRRGIAWALGKDPDKNIALVSYAHNFASKFNRDVQRIIDEPNYREIFPNTSIDGADSLSKTNSIRTSDEFEIVNKKGGLKTVGTTGGLTGRMVDMLIMDDLYKDFQDATSPVISERVWEWYTTVAKTRMHNNSQELIVFTRWSENDLVGRLEEQDLVHTLKPGDDVMDMVENIPKDHFIKINFEAIKQTGPTELDPREIGEALWSSRHDVKKLEATRELDIPKFEALYQGNPKSKEGMLYGDDFKTYNELPVGYVHSYTDTADLGSDFLCSISYVVNGKFAYVTDIIYDDRKNEITEPLVANQMMEQKVSFAKIESNNGGRSFSRNIERMSRASGNGSTKFNNFHQSKNKVARILSNASLVMNHVFMPEGWELRWKKFHKDVTGFLAQGKNKHDDGPDTLTGIVETMKIGLKPRKR